jgi:hypothetical protein
VDISISSEDHEDTQWIECADEMAAVCFSRFKDLRQSKCMMDLTIEVDDCSFRAHKVILAATIPFFNAMFTSEMVEARADTVRLPSMFKKNFLFGYFEQYMQILMPKRWKPS